MCKSFIVIRHYLSFSINNRSCNDISKEYGRFQNKFNSFVVLLVYVLTFAGNKCRKPLQVFFEVYDMWFHCPRSTSSTGNYIKGRLRTYDKRKGHK